ncbi:hypothetical protein ACQKJ1_25690 [Methylorubrum rhodesianum]|jgi:hypothetical protein|uniref:hypothetical protein n=1 Tax=Methylorubrum rhodesianum TaxID=29427 RepID=UPI0037464854
MERDMEPEKVGRGPDMRGLWPKWPIAPMQINESDVQISDLDGSIDLQTKRNRKGLSL